MDQLPTVDGHKVAVNPPHGYHVDFAHPERKFVTGAYVLPAIGMSLMLFFLGQYVFVKLWLLRKLDADTVFLIIAWLTSTAIQVLTIIAFHEGFMGVHAWEIDVDKYTVANKLLVLTPVLYCAVTGFSKTSLVLFYRRLSPQKFWQWACFAAFAFIGGYNIAIFFALIFGCTPVSKTWDTIFAKGTCIDRPAVYIATAVLGIVSDVVLLLMPMPMILRLQMPLRQKLGLVLLFTIGSATLVTSVIRLVTLIPTLNDLDQTWVVANASIWILVEVNLLVICGTLTTVRRFFIHVAPMLIGENSSLRYHFSGSGRASHLRHNLAGQHGKTYSEPVVAVDEEQQQEQYGMTTLTKIESTRTKVRPPARIVEEEEEDDEATVFGTPDSFASALKRQPSTKTVVKGGNKGSENGTWDARPGGDEFESERAIVQTTTVSVVYEERRRSRLMPALLGKR